MLLTGQIGLRMTDERSEPVFEHPADEYVLCGLKQIHFFWAVCFETIIGTTNTGQ